MKDLLFVVLAVAFFGIAGLYVRACARIVGAPDTATVPASPESTPATEVAA